MQIKLVKIIFCFFLISLLSNCETIDKKVTEKTDRENEKLSKYLGGKSEVVKKDFGEPNKIILETPYKIYLYSKTNMLITCTREFFVNPKTDVVEKFKSQNCIK
jgi:hypothetical protein